MNLLPCLVGAAVIALSASGARAGGTETLQRFLDDTRSLRADFAQTVTDSRQVVVEKSSGVLYLERPGKFRWSYAKPFVQEIVGNEGRVWIYDSDLDANGVRLLIDEKSALYLVGSVLDFVDSLQESGFKIENPNASNTCGCGQSFAA